MDKPIPKIIFIGMSFILKCRDIFRPRKDILAEVGIKPNSKVLDFGCGPGWTVWGRCFLVRITIDRKADGQVILSHATTCTFRHSGSASSHYDKGHR